MSGPFISAEKYEFDLLALLNAYLIRQPLRVQY